MSFWRGIWQGLGLAILGLCLQAQAMDASYDAALPAGLMQGADPCAYTACADVLPQAQRFSQRMGHPAYVQAYARIDGVERVVGYVFLSTDVVNIPGYSGQPIVTLIGMDSRGIITGSKVLRHAEPILLLGIPVGRLQAFIHQYVGLFAGSKTEIGHSRADQGYIGLDAISGATVTVIAENQVIMRSARRIAEEVGILRPLLRPAARYTPHQARQDWSHLLAEGAIGHLLVQAEQLGEPDRGAALMDMYFGSLDAPAVGRSLLGDYDDAALRARLAPGEHAIFVIAQGQESFKGSGFVRGGIFDRIQVSQDDRTYTFKDSDYLNLYGLQAEGAPAYRESAIFIIRDAHFSDAYPWHMVFLAHKRDPISGQKSFVSFDQPYWLPAHYLVGGHPQDAQEEAPWKQVWQARQGAIGTFILLLGAAAAYFAGKDLWVRRARRINKSWVAWPKHLLWLFMVIWVGGHLLAQPSITQVLTWFHTMFTHWQWTLFLSDPFIFVFWIFIALSVLAWGRGWFCGWLCPFGSLTELLYQLAGRLGLRRWQFHLPRVWHDRLKWIKYGIFFVLLGLSLYSMNLAEKAAEVEPFKTVFLVGLLHRPWPYSLYATILLGLSLFMERPFCKYLCPLGASLAIPSGRPWWGLRRKAACGPCQACQAGCGSLAIDEQGRIDSHECLLCLDCMVMYYDDHACPPLVQERKHRQRQGLALTRIGDNGAYLPIACTDISASLGSTHLPTSGVTLPRRQGWALYFLPWWPVAGERPDRRPWLAWVLASGLSLAWAMSLALPVLRWPMLLAWGVWSFYESWLRWQRGAYIPAGAWWHGRWRQGGRMDLLRFVASKNLLIAVCFFLIFHAASAHAWRIAWG